MTNPKAASKYPWQFTFTAPDTDYEGKTYTEKLTIDPYPFADDTTTTITQNSTTLANAVLEVTFTVGHPFTTSDWIKIDFTGIDSITFLSTGAPTYNISSPTHCLSSGVSAIADSNIYNGTDNSLIKYFKNLLCDLAEGESMVLKMDIKNPRYTDPNENTLRTVTVAACNSEKLVMEEGLAKYRISQAIEGSIGTAVIDSQNKKIGDIANTYYFVLDLTNIKEVINDGEYARLLLPRGVKKTGDSKLTSIACFNEKVEVNSASFKKKEEVEELTFYSIAWTTGLDIATDPDSCGDWKSFSFSVTKLENPYLRTSDKFKIEVFKNQAAGEDVVPCLAGCSGTDYGQMFFKGYYGSFPAYDKLEMADTATCTRPLEQATVHTTTSLTLSFTPNAKFYKNSPIRFFLPQQQILIPITYVADPPLATVSHTSDTLGDYSCTYYKKDVTISTAIYNIIQCVGSGLNELPAPVVHSITLQGLQNPNEERGAAAISDLIYIQIFETELDAYTDDAKVVQETKKNIKCTPTVEVKNLTDVSVAYEGSADKVGESTSIVIEFTPLTEIPSDGKVRISFPAGTFTQVNDASVPTASASVTFGSGSPTTSTATPNPNSKAECTGGNEDQLCNDIITLIIENPCPVTCVPDNGKKLSITVGYIANPPSTKGTDLGNLKVETLSVNSLPINVGHGTGVLATTKNTFPAGYTITRVPADADIVVGAQAEYTLTFKIKNYIKDTGEIKISLPEEMALETTQYEFGGSAVSTGMVAKPGVITHVLGSGYPQTRNKVLTFKFNATAPQSMKPDSPLKIQTFLTASDTNSLIDEDTSITITATKYNTITSSSITRSSTSLGHGSDCPTTKLSAEVKFVTINPVPAGGKVIVSLPYDHIKTCKAYNSGTSSFPDLEAKNTGGLNILKAATDETDYFHVEVEVPEGGLDSAVEYSFTIYGLANLDYKRGGSTNTFKITTFYDETYGIDKDEDMTDSAPTEEGTLSEITRARTIDYVGSETNYTFGAKLKHDIPVIPDRTNIKQMMQIDLTNQNLYCKENSCVVDNVDFCNVEVGEVGGVTAAVCVLESLELDSDLGLNKIKIIRITDLKCSVHNLCDAGDKLNIVLMDVKNDYSAKDIISADKNTLTTILYNTTSNAVYANIDSGKIDLGVKLTAFGAAAPAITPDANRKVDAEGIELLLNFTPQMRMAADSYLKFTLYKLHFDKQIMTDATIDCYNASTAIKAECGDCTATEYCIISMNIQDIVGSSTYLDTNQPIQLKISPMKNGHSVAAIDYDKFITFEGFDKDNKQIFLAEKFSKSTEPDPLLLLAEDTNSIQFSIADKTAGKTTDMTIKFIPNVLLLDTDVVKVIFSEGGDPNLAAKVVYNDKISDVSKAPVIQNGDGDALENGSVVWKEDGDDRYLHSIEVKESCKCTTLANCKAGTKCTKTGEATIKLVGVRNIYDVRGFPSTGKIIIEINDAGGNFISKGETTSGVFFFTDTIVASTLEMSVKRLGTETNLTLGSICNFNVSLKFPVYIRKDSKITIHIPKHQFAKNVESDAILCSGCSGSYEGGVADVDADYNQVSFIPEGDGLPPGAEKEFTLNNIKNSGAKYLIQNSFKIEVTSDFSDTISYQLDTGIHAKEDLFVEDFPFTAASRSVTYTDQVTTYEFNLTKKVDLEPNGLIRFEFPSEFAYGSSSKAEKCNNDVSECKFKIGSSSYTSTPGDGEITVAVFTTISATDGAAVDSDYSPMKISNILNPPYVKGTYGDLKVLGMQGDLTDETTLIIKREGKRTYGDIANPFAPTPITGQSQTRDSTKKTLSATGVKYTTTFTTVNEIPVNGGVIILFPTKQVVTVGGTYYSTGLHTPSDLVCSKGTETGGLLEVKCLSPSLVAGNTEIIVVIDNCNNPDALEEIPTSFKIRTVNDMSNKYIIDEGTADCTPLLESTPLTVQNITPNTGTLTGADTLISVQIFIPTVDGGKKIDKNGKIILVPPPNLVYVRTSGVKLCTYKLAVAGSPDVVVNSFPCVYESDVSTNIIKKITYDPICTAADCLIGSTITLTFTAANPIHTKTITVIENDESTKFYVYSKKENVDIGMGYWLKDNKWEFTANTFTSMSVDTGSCKTVSSSCSVSVSLTTTNPIPKKDTTKKTKGALTITIPKGSKEFDVSQISGYTVVGGSQVFTCPDISASDIKTTGILTCITLNEIPSNTKITATFTNLVLPPSTLAAKIAIKSTYDDDTDVGGEYDPGAYEIDKGEGIFNTGEAKNTTGTAVRSTPTTVNELIDLTITIKAPTELPGDALIKVVLPTANQMVLKDPSETTISCQRSDNKNTLTPCTAKLDSTTSEQSVTIPTYCGTLGSPTCPAGTTVSIIILQLKNAPHVKLPLNSTTDSFKIYTIPYPGEAASNLQHQAVEGIFATPELTPAQLTLTLLTRDIHYTSRKVKLDAQFSPTKTDMPTKGKLYLTFPEKLFYHYTDIQEVSALDFSRRRRILQEDTADNFSIQCNISNYEEDATNIKSVYISGFCASAACVVDSAIKLRLINLYNPKEVLSTENLTENVTISTATANGYLLERANKNATEFGDLKPTEISKAVIWAEDASVGVTTNYHLAFYFDAVISTSINLEIILPAELTINTGRRNLQEESSTIAATTCSSGLGLNSNLSCSISTESRTITISNPFASTYQDGIFIADINSITNSATPGETSTFQLIMRNTDDSSVFATKIEGMTTDSLTAIADQTTCDSTCGKCAGTTSTCVSCKIPSGTPLLLSRTCADSCGTSNFLFSSFCLPCFDENCEECVNHKKNSCTKCKSGYIMSDGQCTASCSTGTKEEGGLCVNEDSTKCASTCKTCSESTDFCLTCDTSGTFSFLKSGYGECVGECPTGTYNDSVGVCLACNHECGECTGGTNENCTSCAAAFSKYKDPGKTTCLTGCEEKYYANETERACLSCHKDCYTCSGGGNNECLSCEKDEHNYLLFLSGTSCISSCDKDKEYNYVDNTCDEFGSDILLHWSSIAIMILTGLILILFLLSFIWRKKGSPFATIFALMAMDEFFNRLFLTWHLWNGPSVWLFAFSLVSWTEPCCLAVLYDGFVFADMMNLKRYFGPIKDKHGTAIKVIKVFCAIFGLNFYRIFCSGLFGIPQITLPFKNHPFFRKPLMKVANVGQWLQLSQFIIIILVFIFRGVHSPEFSSAIISSILTLILVIFQFGDYYVIRKMRDFPYYIADPEGGGGIMEVILADDQNIPLSAAGTGGSEGREEAKGILPTEVPIKNAVEEEEKDDSVDISA